MFAISFLSVCEDSQQEKRTWMKQNKKEWVSAWDNEKETVEENVKIIVLKNKLRQWEYEKLEEIQRLKIGEHRS